MVPVRLLGRLTLLLVLDAAALLALSALLPGFALAGPAAALGLAVVLGVGNAVGGPVLLRVALPFTVLTLGLGTLLLNAVLLLAASAVVESVRVSGLWSALAVVLGLT